MVLFNMSYLKRISYANQSKYPRFDNSRLKPLYQPRTHFITVDQFVFASKIYYGVAGLGCPWHN